MAISNTLAAALAVDELEIDQLEEQLSNEERFGKSDSETIRRAARNMLSMLLPYQENRETMGDAIKKAILADLAERYATMRYNDGIEEMNALQLTQAGAGITIIAGFVLPTAGIEFTHYKSSVYEVTNEAEIQEVQRTGPALKVADEATPAVVAALDEKFG